MKSKSRRIEYNGDFLYDWLVKIKPELPIRLTDIRRWKGRVTFHFEGFPRQILGSLNSWGFTFWGQHLRRYDDMISDIDIIPRKDKRGYFCGLCRKPKFYTGKDKFWHDHIFSGFKKFIEEDLLTAEYLVYMASYSQGKRRGVSACELVRDRDALMRELGRTNYLANNLKAVPKEGEDWKLPAPSDTLIDFLVPLKRDTTKIISQTGMVARK